MNVGRLLLETHLNWQPYKLWTAYVHYVHQHCFVARISISQVYQINWHLIYVQYADLYMLKVTIFQERVFIFFWKENLMWEIAKISTHLTSVKGKVNLSDRLLSLEALHINIERVMSVCPPDANLRGVYEFRKKGLCWPLWWYIR